MQMAKGRTTCRGKRALFLCDVESSFFQSNLGHPIGTHSFEVVIFMIAYLENQAHNYFSRKALLFKLTICSDDACATRVSTSLQILPAVDQTSCVNWIFYL